jgi:MATE family multidrug resistance protein
VASDRLEGQTEKGSYGEICRLAAPLMLSTSGFMLMHLLDAIFLARYSENAIAAAGTAGMAGFTVISFFGGVTGYVATFVAQYVGAKRPERVGAAVWQSIYLALASVLLIAGMGLAAGPLFRWVGHEEAIQSIEIAYFQVICWTAALPVLGGALAGFYIGRGDTATLMVAQLLGFLVNGFLSYGLIFGEFGLPRWGATGAAWATAFAQCCAAVPLLIIFFRRKYRSVFHTWSGRAFEPDLLKRLIRYGMPDGLRFTVEMVAFTVFLFIVGRLGSTELAATNIVWRVNGFAFFPLIGLSRAIATVVGHAQGAGRPETAERSAYRGLVISQAWMLFAAAIFLLLPREMLSLFASHEEAGSAQTAETIAMGVVLLRFVALYCVLDGLNVIFLGALQGAGDTRWTSAVSITINVIFLAVELFMDRRHATLNQLWTALTVVVMFQALVWMARFRTGHWKKMRVIEHAAENGA